MQSHKRSEVFYLPVWSTVQMHLTLKYNKVEMDTLFICVTCALSWLAVEFRKTCRMEKEKKHQRFSLPNIPLDSTSAGRKTKQDNKPHYK